ncbi:MAG TPA: triose-phosphate isomerase [Candidatus Paceibacterota bacterium]|nr:triose-phosphate isomerase [Candidatus Paceibacterota bacterium]
MNKAKRNFILVGNWKMHPDTREEAKALFAPILKAAKAAQETTVVIAPPAPFIHDLTGKEPVHISAQDVSEHAEGAFTGSVSARELKSAGAEYTIVGHSERRAAGDTDAIVAKKVAEALRAGLRVIVCIGESERDAHAQYLRSIREQIVGILSAVDKKLARWITIAYEPVWVIGKSYDTSLKPADIHEMVIYIRKVAAEVLGKNAGLKVPVLYGGSVDFEHAKTMLADSAADGLLIGRQSLDPKAFSSIIEYADSL